MTLLHERGVLQVMLDATEAGRPLYETFGFQQLYRMEIWVREAREPRAAEMSNVRWMVPDDLPEVVALDAELYGLPRPQVLEARLRPAWVTVDSGKVTGYLLSRVNENGASLGPWYHRSEEGAEALLSTALFEIGDRAVRIDIPELNSQAKTIATRCGLTYRRYCTRMLYREQPPWHMTDQYGIASFATG